MIWRDLLGRDTPFVAPWIGTSEICLGKRRWRLDGRMPPEYMWGEFRPRGGRAQWAGSAEPAPDVLVDIVRGYLVGDRLVPDQARVPATAAAVAEAGELIYLVDPALSRFVRVVAGRPCVGSPLVYRGLDMPLGPEDEVQTAFEDRVVNLDRVRGVVPALDLAFRMEVLHREEIENRRAAVARALREEEARQALSERRQQLVLRAGSAVGRRQLAAVDFVEAARRALGIGGAEYLDSRPSAERDQRVVRFRIAHRRFECVCHVTTLQILDAGVCLDGDDWLLSLEALPSVILEAIRLGRLHVYRRVDDYEFVDGDSG